MLLLGSNYFLRKSGLENVAYGFCFCYQNVLFYENVKCVVFAKVSLIYDFTDLPHTFKRWISVPNGYGALKCNRLKQWLVS